MHSEEDAVSRHQKVRKGSVFAATLLLMLVVLAVPALAGWVRSGSTYVFQDEQTGTTYKSMYFAEAKAGLVKISGKWYVYTSKGKLYNGFLDTNTDRYFSNKGLLVRSAWITVSGKKYRAASNGKFYRNKLVTISGSTYLFDQDGVMLTGVRKVNKKVYCFLSNGKMVKSAFVTISKKKYYFGANGVLVKSSWVGKRYVDSKGVMAVNAWVGDRYVGADGEYVTGVKTIGGKTYCFSTSDGKLIKSAFVTVSGKKYYFGSDGVLVKSAWVGKYYVDKNGVLVKNQWVNDRYVGSNGKYVTGLQQIGGVYYYFNTSTGRKETNTTKVVDGVTYTFDASGRGTASRVDSTLESSYYTDPAVSEEALLSAIIYCESGNQPYYGQMAVGMVIMNRVKSSLFPNDIKKVIYAKSQFTPSYNGALTKVLNNPSLITANAKKAAQEVLAKVKKNDYTLQDENGKTVKFDGYCFFMTPAAYQRLGLKSAYITIGAHVFFKTWG